MANFFIVHTPFHLYVVRKIIENQDKKNNHINIIVLEFKNKIPDTGNLEILHLEYLGGRVPGYNKWIVAERNMELLKSVISRYSMNIVYLSDVAWPMNNRIFFDKSLNCTYRIFTDGIGNYIGQIVTPKLFVRNVCKQILGVIKCGVKYTSYLGDVVGQSQKRVSEVHGFGSIYLEAPVEKRRELLISSTDFNSSKERNAAIFLDQPYIVGYKNWNSLRQATIEKLLSINMKWYYKAHHFGQEQDKEIFLKHGIIEYKSENCIEEVFDKEKFGLVVSYNSTALFTLKIIFGDNVRCIAIDDPNLVLHATQNDKQANDKLLALYAKVGVKIVFAFT